MGREKPVGEWLVIVVLLVMCVSGSVMAGELKQDKFPFIETLQEMFEDNPGKSGVYVLEKGEESLLARGWMAEQAEKTIEVQYFIWSTDNIGILAAEALLLAAERGVKVRVIVDDLLIDAPDETMLGLAAHPNIHVRIYNPKHSVGVSLWQRLVNLVREFRSANQRMHDKTFVVDGIAAVTGGRNMADEYFDYNHTYNFRDRDVLVLGPAAAEVKASFERFWQWELTVNVEELLEDEGKDSDRKDWTGFYEDLHRYAQNPENYEREVAESLQMIPRFFPGLRKSLVWDDVEFISDMPGKNSSEGLGGGGKASRRLVEILASASKKVTIQSPYLVVPEGGIDLFHELEQKGVQVRVNTNSLASTDNLQAFSGYSKQREAIIGAGVEIFEYRPTPQIQKELIERYERIAEELPVFAIHAKTMVVDSEYLFIGTFNFDPRSLNLNTEVGVLIHNRQLAAQVEQSIERDMAAENSWNAEHDDPDQFAPWLKRFKVFFWKLLPLEPIL
ncbi:phosphatidylserine/phosphatidylglycerophosphate/cardiolipin synthase family protein [Desulfopila sp. IMCC35008]|uniref:phospholipase D-like domain-containing protein n=1 Tax=Desulfopila sp. IMCC35008 TaxID=2653858 RepID=UPI00197ACA7C|nr:phospholipase D family protein [Desulfopila sp. IMCC35008]